MARVIARGEARSLGLPGRASLEIVSSAVGARQTTLRLVEIAVPDPDEAPRGPHLHRDFEECIYVLSGEGTTHADSGDHPLRQGDTIVIPPGERHVTRNTGVTPLVLLCFFPTDDVAPGTEDAAFPGQHGKA